MSPVVGDTFDLVTRTRSSVEGEPPVVAYHGRALVVNVWPHSLRVVMPGPAADLMAFVWEPGNKHHRKQHGVSPDFALWLEDPAPDARF